MQDAVGQHKVLKDLSAILQAAKEGRADLLIVQEDFKQAVRMTGEFSFDLVNDNTTTGIIEDITSEIAWDVISMKGRAIFTDLEEFKIFGRAEEFVDVFFEPGNCRFGQCYSNAWQKIWLPSKLHLWNPPFSCFGEVVWKILADHSVVLLDGGKKRRERRLRSSGNKM